MRSTDDSQALSANNHLYLYPKNNKKEILIFTQTTSCEITNNYSHHYLHSQPVRTTDPSIIIGTSHVYIRVRNDVCGA